MVFRRTAWATFIKLGSRQKSMQKYKRARGRHNKIRQKEKSRPVNVEIGFRNKVSERGLINGKMPVLVYNIQDLKKVGKDNIAVIGQIGMKNKIEIAREIQKSKIEVLNLNVTKLLKEAERKMKNNKNDNKTKIPMEKAK